MQPTWRKLQPRSSRHQREGGYLLLAIMLMMAFLVVTLTYVVGPKLVQQIKRDREAEMIHRGTEYARAIKKFYKKNGRYPASLDDLDKGQIRYLRKRYKDPLTKDGKWKLLNYGDIQSVLNANAPGTPAAALGQQGGAFGQQGSAFGQQGSAFGQQGSAFGQQGSAFGQQGSAFGASGAQGTTFGFGSSSTPGAVQGQPTSSPFAGGGQQFGGQNPGSVSGVSTGSDQGGNSGGSASSNTFGSNSSTGGTDASNPNQQVTSGTGQTGGAFGGTTLGQNSSGTNQVFGGGAIVGVASISKEKTIRIYNKKKTYDEWQFIYNPAMDQQNVLLRGPYQPTTIGNTNIGTPAGQLNGQQQGAFGQQNNGFGQQNSGFGQQNGGFGQSSGFGQQQQPQQPGTSSSPSSSSQ